MTVKTKLYSMPTIQDSKMHACLGSLWAFLVCALSPIYLVRPKDTAKIVLEVCFLSDLETQMLIQAWIFLEVSLA